MAPSETPLLFAAHESLPTEMARLARLRREQPEVAASMMYVGDKLVQLARSGKLRALHSAVTGVPKDHMLTWVIMRMFREACLANQVHVVHFMLERGVDMSQVPLQTLLHDIVACAKYDNSEWVALVKILTENGFPTNTAPAPQYVTPLHMACERELVTLAEALINAGADVNAVSEDDRMPLTCADEAAKRHKLMVTDDKPTPMQALLLARGAKRSWRKNTDTPSRTTILPLPQHDEEDPARASRRAQRMRDFLDAAEENREGYRTFSAGC